MKQVLNIAYTTIAIITQLDEVSYSFLALFI